MDQELSSTYKAALALLSEDGRASLRDGQRQWVKVVRLICDTSVLPDKIFSDKTPPAECIKSKYDDRREQLEKAVKTYGKFKIYRVDIFSAHRYPQSEDEDDYAADTGADPGFVTLNVSYPQIDDPKSDSEKAWNEKMKSLGYDAGDGNLEDTLSGYEILSVSEKLISVSISSDRYDHGAAHGEDEQSIVNWLLPSGRDLKAEDIFDNKTSWKDALTKLCFRELHDRYGFGAQPEDLEDTPTQPERWVLREGGLTIQFDEGEVGSYADGEREVLVPWSKLKPYLLSTAPITLGLPYQWLPKQDDGNRERHYHLRFGLLTRSTGSSIDKYALATYHYEIRRSGPRRLFGGAYSESRNCHFFLRQGFSRSL
jgi:hypothetical protein